MHLGPSFVPAAHLQSTSLTYVCTYCRTSLVCTAVRHLYVLRIWHHYLWLYLYALLICCHHCQTRFVSIVEPIGMYPVQHSYVLQNCSAIFLCPIFLHVLPLPPFHIQTHFRTSLVRTTVLYLYTLLACHHHRRPPFVRIAQPCFYDFYPKFLHVPRLPPFQNPARLPPLPLSYVHSRCTSASNINDLRSYVLLNHVATYFYPTFLDSPYLPS